MGAKDHREHAEKTDTARAAILTVTDSKTRENDTSGKRAFEIFQKFGHTVVLHEIVPNQRKKLAARIRHALEEADVVVTIGGTGVSRKDLSVEAARSFMEKE